MRSGWYGVTSKDAGFSIEFKGKSAPLYVAPIANNKKLTNLQIIVIFSPG